MKVLLVRCDRLGDLVLALPAFAWLRQARPGWEIHALVTADAAPLVEHDPAVQAFYTWDGGLDGELAGKLATERYDAAVLLQYQTPLAWLLYMAGIRRRYGPLSRLSSWFLLNRGSWQRRSRLRHHESRYNVDLVRRLAGPDVIAPALAPPRLHLGEVQRQLGRRFRREEAAGADVVAFVHPGSGGSALDWQPAHFARVAGELADRPGWRVFVTGSHHDRPVIDALAPHLDPRVGVLAERYPLRDFLGVLAAGDVLIAPSTGPLHLAAALDLAVVGIYPPAPTMSPRRWGPLGRWAEAVTPQLDCPSRRHCLLTHCLFYNCLDMVVPRQVIAAALALVDARTQDRNAATGPVE
jgi:heptosyltransferase III